MLNPSPDCVNGSGYRPKVQSTMDWLEVPPPAKIFFSLIAFEHSHSLMLHLALVGLIDAIPSLYLETEFDIIALMHE